VAAATGAKACEQGLAAVVRDERSLYDGALETIGDARAATEALMREGIIPAPPEP
jgi:hypothetical protein